MLKLKTRAARNSAQHKRENINMKNIEKAGSIIGITLTLFVAGVPFAAKYNAAQKVENARFSENFVKAINYTACINSGDSKKFCLKFAEKPII